MKYEQVVKDTWRQGLSEGPADDELLLEIVRCATLAPSSHNTQCWKFKIESRDQREDRRAAFTVLPDLSRRCPVVDPDDHHLYVSLGAALENLVISAEALRFAVEVDSRTPKEGIQVFLTPGSEKSASPLVEAIPKRQCTRTEYDSEPLSSDEINLLQRAGTGDGVSVLIFTKLEDLRIVEDYALMANSAQLNDKRFIKELINSIRFNEWHAVSSGDGLYGKCMGHTDIPGWIGRYLVPFLVSESAENKKLVKQLRSSAGVAIFVSEHGDCVHCVEAGRCYERFALQATLLGVRNAMINMPVEGAEIRPLFSKALGLKETETRIDLVVRFGKGPEVPRSLRRPLDAVIVH